MRRRETARAWAKLIAGDPRYFITWLVSTWPRSTFSKLVDWDATERPHFAYGLLSAAREAKALQIPEIAAIEFGVAGGNGLVALERLGLEVERETGVRIKAYGFDSGVGMPEPIDYRDLPYMWQPGQFPMDVDKLRNRLTSSELVLGDVSDTAPRFFEDFEPPPIGFVSVDVDYYSSTVGAFKLFDADPSRYLPRVLMHLDDVIGDDMQMGCEYVGELLAVKEFNDAHEERKIAPIYALELKRRIPEVWNKQHFVFHVFDHKEYGTFVPSPSNSSAYALDEPS